MCDCITQIDEKLKEYNTGIDASISLKEDIPVKAKVATYKLDSKKRGNAMSLVATFCPFCGQRYYENDPSRNYGLEQWISDLQAYGEPEFFSKSDGFLAVFNRDGITWTTSTYDEYERRDHNFSTSLKFPKTFYLEFEYDKYKKENAK